MNVCRSSRSRAPMSGRWTPPLSSPSPSSDAEDRGSAAVELVVLAPVFVVLLLFVVFLGRMTEANTKVRHAADQAARAASMVNRNRAGAVASATAISELTADGIRCAGLSVTSSSSSTAGLEAIEVTVSCTVPSADLAPLAPGQRTMTATSTEVIDVIRAVDE